MIIPIRCLTCNKIIANKWESYVFYIESGVSVKDTFDKIKITRYCCKRMFLTHVEMIDKLLLM